MAVYRVKDDVAVDDNVGPDILRLLSRSDTVLCVQLL